MERNDEVVAVTSGPAPSGSRVCHIYRSRTQQTTRPSTSPFEKLDECICLGLRVVEDLHLKDYPSITLLDYDMHCVE